MSQERILIVDGDSVLSETLRTRLEAAGYLVDCASNGNEAMAILKTKWIDLIVLAFVLQGGMDGFQLFKEIKKNKELSKIPVVVETSKIAMKKTFEMMGAETFFIKPYSVDLFLDRVRDILLNFKKEVCMAKTIKTGPKNLMKKLKSIKARNIMSKDVITATPDTTLADIAELMIKKRISGLPVIGKKGKIVGIITATDLFVIMDMITSGDVTENGETSTSNPTVRFAMSTDVVKVKRNMTLDEIIAIMKYKNVHTLPVFDGNRMVGVIGRHDVFKSFYAVVKDLYK